MNFDIPTHNLNIELLNNLINNLKSIINVCKNHNITNNDCYDMYYDLYIEIALKHKSFEQYLKHNDDIKYIINNINLFIKQYNIKNNKHNIFNYTTYILLITNNKY